MKKNEAIQTNMKKNDVSEASSNGNNRRAGLSSQHEKVRSRTWREIQTRRSAAGESGGTLYVEDSEEDDARTHTHTHTQTHTPTQTQTQTQSQTHTQTHTDASSPTLTPPQTDEHGLCVCVCLPVCGE